MKYKIGYTQGTYDMFHIGHLNLINAAKKQCDYLIVGVNANSLVEQYKHKTPVIDEKERLQIISNLKAVDDCFLVDTLDKLTVWKKHPFNAIFIGDDWKGNARWKETEIQLGKVGSQVVYLPYTAGISSSKLSDFIKQKLAEDKNTQSENNRA